MLACTYTMYIQYILYYITCKHTTTYVTRCTHTQLYTHIDIINILCIIILKMTHICHSNVTMRIHILCIYNIYYITCEHTCTPYNRAFSIVCLVSGRGGSRKVNKPIYIIICIKKYIW